MGAMGSALLAVLTIAGLRHTGRALQTSALWSVPFAFGLITLGTSLRVFGPVLALDMWDVERLTAFGGLLWGAGFLVWLFQFGPWLVSAHQEGVAG